MPSRETRSIHTKAGYRTNDHPKLVAREIWISVRRLREHDIRVLRRPFPFIRPWPIEHVWDTLKLILALRQIWQQKTYFFSIYKHPGTTNTSETLTRSNYWNSIIIEIIHSMKLIPFGNLVRFSVFVHFIIPSRFILQSIKLRLFPYLNFV